MATCTLCGLGTRFPIQAEDGSLYCCPACQEVAGLLEEEAPASTVADLAPEAVGAETIHFSLSGLWCSSCAWLIERRLQRADGVSQARVSFIRREARVRYDPETTSTNRLKRMVRRLGYGASDDPHDEEEGFFTRMLIGGMIAMHIMALSGILYVRSLLGLASPDTEWLAEFFHLMTFAAAIPLLLLLGLPILKAGMASLLRGQPNTHTLVALGAFSASALSAHNLFIGQGGVYFDTVAMLLLLITFGRWLEMQAHKSSGEAVDRLSEQLPLEASLVTENGESSISIDELHPGSRIRIRPGEGFPADGIVASGEGEVDESLMTGEPSPVLHGEGDLVLAGTVNLDGAFDVIVSAVGDRTQAGQIGRLLHQAALQRSPVERKADRLAARLVPLAIGLAAVTFWFWSSRIGPEAAMLNALSVVLIACPCALALATPLTLWQGVGRAARSGIILARTAVFEALDEVGRVYFDKTGTLTQLPLRVQRVSGERDFLPRVAAAEAGSEHPLAVAMLAAASMNGAEKGHFTATHFRALPGRGVHAEVDGTPTWVGSLRLMEQQQLVLSSGLSDTAAKWQAAGATVVYAGWGGRVRGLLGMGERLRSEALGAIQSLQDQGKRVAVLTGDDPVAGQRLAERLQVSVRADLRPEEKLSQLGQEPAAMVGDGINDGPALAAATVGIAMHQGTEVAQAASEVVLVREDLRAIPWLFELTEAVMHKVRQNLVWAVLYNAVGITLAMAGILQPVLAALAMVVSSLVVTYNALRLRRFPGLVPDEEPEPLPFPQTRILEESAP